MKIKVSEIYRSMQGEGLHVGVPSLFLRVFGCNFKCAGFGMERGKLSEEYKSIDPSKYKRYHELPLVHTGCESYGSWDSRFEYLSKNLEISDIVDQFQSLLPDGKFNDIHLVITGGEPLLGWQSAYKSLIQEILKREMNLNYLTFETNGTQKLQEDLCEYFNDLYYCLEVTFAISSKLPSSGEQWDKAILRDVVRTYLNVHNKKAFFKWVCSSPQDLEDVIRAKKEYELGYIKLPIYLMPAGSTEKLYIRNKLWLPKICMEHGFRYSPRLQVELFGNQRGT